MPPRPLLAALAVAGAAAVLGSASPPSTAAAPEPIPQTEGWVLVVSRCVICHGVEIAVQQRQGPHGWGQIIDRMVSYGMPLTAEERQTLIAYLVRHFGDPDGR
jgi:cytochrome c2